MVSQTSSNLVKRIMKANPIMSPHKYKKMDSAFVILPHEPIVLNSNAFPLVL
jgi:hypothetical protein